MSCSEGMHGGTVQWEEQITWRFRLHLKGIDEVTEEWANRIYEACPDSTITSSCDRTWVSFDRDADALQVAIRSAVADIRRLGLEVGRVEIEESELAQEEIAHWLQPA